VTLITHGTEYPGPVPDFAGLPSEGQDPELEQFITEGFPGTETEQQFAWDPYQT
jgi:hypothetical protein